MKNVIFPDEAITCECGFEGTLTQITKHFKKTWEWVYDKETEIGGINKHGHHTKKWLNVYGKEI
jgi:hypothetical protein